jgi:hypothetical protein
VNYNTKFEHVNKNIERQAQLNNIIPAKAGTHAEFAWDAANGGGAVARTFHGSSPARGRRAQAGG